MQYDTIILELLSRIKTLESEVATLKEKVAAFTEAAVPSSAISSGEDESESRHQRTTDQMIEVCYKSGKLLHQGHGLADLVDGIQQETGMNRNTAIMYLYAVNAMLGGTIYKRAINAKATEKYLQMIFNEYGSAGLKKALNAIQLHIQYRENCGHNVDSIIEIYERFKNRL